MKLASEHVQYLLNWIITLRKELLFSPHYIHRVDITKNNNGKSS